MHRGQVACRAVLGTHAGLHANFQAAMAQAAAAAAMGGASTAIVVQGEGPIGCLAMAAQACMPHLLRTCCLVTEQHQQQTRWITISDATNLFQSLAQVFQSICASPHPCVRVLTLEPLYALHARLVQLVVVETTPPLQQKLETSIETVLVDHFFIVSINDLEFSLSLFYKAICQSYAHENCQFLCFAFTVSIVLHESGLVLWIPQQLF